MARPKPDELPPEQPSSFVASAVRLPPVTPKLVGSEEGWQADAWRCFDTVPELRYIATWVGNVMSKARLYAAQRVGQSVEIHDTGPAAEAMDAFFNGYQGQCKCLQATGVNLTVAGECYWLSRSAGADWSVLGSGKVGVQGRQVRADWGDGRQELSPSDLTIRCWNPHPQNPYRADSPTRSNLRTLSEIVTIEDHISAQLVSRLAGAGILFLPNGMTAPNAPDIDPAASQGDQLMSILAEAMTTPIKDRSNPSALVPILVTVDGEYLKNILKMDFWSKLDDVAIQMRDAAIKRLAIGMDTPPEVLLGMGDTNHWSAWQVDEASVKAHLEPRLASVTEAITTAYLRPALQGIVPDPETWYCVADTSEIRLRPDRSREAMEAYDRGEISGDALRREVGFKPEDAPSTDEAREWLLRKIAMGSTSPEQTAAALKILGASLESALPPAVSINKPMSPKIAPRRSLDQHPNENPPDRGEAQDRSEYPSRQPQASLLLTCEFLVFRALERAGNRLINRKGRDTELQAVPPHRRYLQASDRADYLLESTWDPAAELLSEYVTDTNEVIAVLDFYVRGLLTTQRPYSRTTLATLLDREVRGDTGPGQGAAPSGAGREAAHGTHPGPGSD